MTIGILTRAGTLALLAGALAGLAAAAGAATVPPEIEKLRGILARTLRSEAETNRAALASVAQDYFRDLGQLAFKAKAAKDAAGAALARQEAGRYLAALQGEPDLFEALPELPAESRAKAPELLRVPQKTYAESRAAVDAARDAAAKTLARQCIGALATLEQNARASGRTALAAAAKKEATKLRVLLQRKDAVTALFLQAGVPLAAMPPAAGLSLDGFGETAPAARPGLVLTPKTLITSLPPAVQQALTAPVEKYDPEWPPEIFKWKYESAGNYSHDFSVYGPKVPDELGILPYPKTLRAYVAGVRAAASGDLGGGRQTRWIGKAVAWRVADSRDLTAKIFYTTRHPALNETVGPAACVAIYSINEGDRLLASMCVPMLEERTEVRVQKVPDYNRLGISWKGAKRKRGFTIPDHTPLRVVAGVVSFAPGEEIDAVIELHSCPIVEEKW